MKFAIITHVPHGIENQKFYAYSPYVKEMNIWIKHFDELIIVAPLYLKTKTSITHEYQKDNVDFRVIRQFNFLNIFSIIKSVIYLPKVCLTIFIAMKNADHIHLRCPGNVGLLACFIQILFPAKSKTAKYAGNWDANAKQPLSYKLQKWLLNNKFITKKMQVLVYGEWKKTTKNIKPFFTASYYEIEKKEIEKKTLKNKISFVFVGTLSIGKQPLYALMIINELIKKGYNVELSFYGE